jgi:magnesium and cobalt exporter, CNNM family
MAEPVHIDSVIWRILIVVGLVVANAFFVAAEFALVAVRRSRIESRAAEGDRSAKVVRSALSDLDRFISATQLGITFASLALGWYGEEALAAMFDWMLTGVGVEAPTKVVHGTAALIIAFIVITFLHIVLGELAPKSIALVAPEAVSRFIAPPLLVFERITSPLVWVLNGAATGLLRLFGLRTVSEARHVHSPEELRLLVMQSRAHGALDETDTAMLAGVFDFHAKRVRDVMRPRTEIVAVALDADEQEIWRLLREERYSRYPVYDGTLDDVVGVLLAKDLWLRDSATAFSLGQVMRKPLYVPDNRPAERVLDDLRRTRAHMAVVLDEYGGTAGIVTLEDLVEEVIGDINDEYDLATRSAIEMEGILELAGSMSLVDVRSDYQLPIPDGDWTTLGGYTFATLGRIPHVGDRAPFPGGELEVVAMSGRRVAAVRVLREGAADTPAQAASHDEPRPVAHGGTADRASSAHQQ